MLKEKVYARIKFESRDSLECNINEITQIRALARNNWVRIGSVTPRYFVQLDQLDVLVAPYKASSPQPKFLFFKRIYLKLQELFFPN